MFEKLYTMITVANIVLVVLIMISGILGIIFNGAVALMGVIRSDLKQDYVWFIIGTTATNVVYCMVSAILQPIIIIGGLTENGTLCQMTGFLVVWSGTSSLLTQPFLALNRYSALFHREQHAKRFSKRNISLMLLFVFLLALINAICYMLLGDIGRLDDTICAVDLDKMPVWHFIIITLLPTGISYSISITCGVKISRFLKKHENDSRRLELRTMIKETQQIMKLIFIEIFVPFCLECPALAMVIIAMFVDINPVLFSVAVGGFVAHNPVDPVIIVAVVKPYRTAMKKILNRLRNNTVVSTTTAINFDQSVIQNVNFSNYLT